MNSTNENTQLMLNTDELKFTNNNVEQNNYRQNFSNPIIMNEYNFCSFNALENFK